MVEDDVLGLFDKLELELVSCWLGCNARMFLPRVLFSLLFRLRSTHHVEMWLSASDNVGDKVPCQTTTEWGPFWSPLRQAELRLF